MQQHAGEQAHQEYRVLPAGLASAQIRDHQENHQQNEGEV